MNWTIFLTTKNSNDTLFIMINNMQFFSSRLMVCYVSQLTPFKMTGLGFQKI